MIDPETNESAGFWRNMRESMLNRLSANGKKKQVIGQAELYPVIVARRFWSEKIRDRDGFHFVDNDSARYAPIKGSSPCLESAWLVQAFWTLESETSESRSWIARVPSKSNIADGPSRGDRSETEKLFPTIKWLQWIDEQEDADAKAQLI